MTKGMLVACVVLSVSCGSQVSYGSQARKIDSQVLKQVLNTDYAHNLDTVDKNGRPRVPPFECFDEAGEPFIALAVAKSPNEVTFSFPRDLHKTISCTFISGNGQRGPVITYDFKERR